MYRIVNGLPWRLKKHVIAWFMKKNNVDCGGLPLFYGGWPDINNEGEISIGTNCYFRSFRLRQHITVLKNAKLRIAHNAFLNDGVNICSSQSIMIGHHAKIGDMTYIYDTDFHEVSSDLPIRHQPVVIGDNVWIGAMSIILPGSVIGDHSVIAAGSIVTGEIPAKILAAGSPAKAIKTLNMPDDWVRK